jgi:hypothetical protein
MAEPPFARMVLFIIIWWHRGSRVRVIWELVFLFWKRGAAVDHQSGRLARWWWQESKNFSLEYLYGERGRAVCLASSWSQTTWAVSRGGMVIHAIRHYFSSDWIEWGPPWLVKDAVNKVLCARIMGGHANGKFVEGDNKLVEVRDRWVGWGWSIHGFLF